jgi:hypothetical protein
MKNNELNVNGIIVKASYYNALKDFDNETFAIVFRALCEYGFTGVEPVFNNAVHNMAFQLIKPNIDSDLKRYKASAENGKKGGRPPKKETIQKEEITETLKPEVVPDTQVEEKVTQIDSNEESIDILEYVRNNYELDTNFLFEVVDYVKRKEDKHYFSKNELKFVNKLVNDYINEKEAA